MACENLSNYYPIIMKFSGYLLLYEDTSAIDFGPNRSIPIFSFSFAILVFVKRSPILQKMAGRLCHGTWKFWPASGPFFLAHPNLLPCQWKYWHRAKNRLPDKTGFGMYTPQNVEKSGFGQSVCVSVCLSGRLAVAFPASSHRRKV